MATVIEKHVHRVPPQSRAHVLEPETRVYYVPKDYDDPHDVTEQDRST